MAISNPLIALLQRMVRSNSVSGNEAEVAGIYAEFANSVGFSPTISGRNVFFERRVNDGPTLLLNSHLDTVKAGSTWTRDPWDGKIEEDRVHGLGANDATGCVVAQLGAALRLKDMGWNGNLVVCASCDEETGGAGMEVVVNELPRFDAALIGEPNNFAVAAGQRGLVKGFLKIPGRRAHASRPWQGHNAIHAAARVIGNLDNDGLNVPNDLTRATLQITLIEGGSQSNVLPDTCTLTVDSRTTPHFDNDRMIAHLNEAAARESGVFEVYSDRFRPVHTADDSALVRAALEVTGQPAAGVFPSVCDLFWVAHVPALVMGPGQPERSHQADEFVRIPEVLDGVATYVALAEAWLARVKAS